jgi:hypothetical protein
MSRVTFGEGVLVALTAALVAAVMREALGFFLPRGDVAQLLCMGLGLGYGLYLLARSPESVGRLVVVLLWVGVSLVVGVLFAGIAVQVLTQLALVWLVRSLYHHADPLAAFLDLGLLLFGLAAAMWALNQTGSLFLGVWTLMLVQALFVLIPGRIRSAGREPSSSDPFDTAASAAERALRRLSIHD